MTHNLPSHDHTCLADPDKQRQTCKYDLCLLSTALTNIAGVLSSKIDWKLFDAKWFRIAAEKKSEGADQTVYYFLFFLAA